MSTHDGPFFSIDQQPNPRNDSDPEFVIFEDNLAASKSTPPSGMSQTYLEARSPRKDHMRGSMSNEEDLKSIRLISVYRIAKDDFLDSPAGTLKRTKAARFLRDTIENCLAHMSLFADSVIEDMQRMLKEAIASAEEGCGGRKRPFDEGFSEEPQIGSKQRTSKVPISPHLSRQLYEGVLCLLEMKCNRITLVFTLYRKCETQRTFGTLCINNSTWSPYCFGEQALEFSAHTEPEIRQL